MLIFWSESLGNAVKKAKGSVWLHKQEVDVLHSRVELLVYQCCHSSEVLNLNNSLNIKIIKKKFIAVDQAVACAPVKQRARVRSPVGTSFLSFFGVFPHL